MRKIKIVLAIFLSLIVTFVLVAFFVPQTRNMPERHLRLKLNVSQIGDRLTLKGVALEEGYPSDYKLNIPSNFIKFKIEDKNHEVLFTGMIARIQRTIVEQFGNLNGKSTLLDYSEKDLDNIELYLPYFSRAESVIFTDDVGVNLLTVSIGKLEVPVDKSNLCGNGICDFNESILSCYRDCGFRR